jgi:hypothetical protein
VAIGTGSSGSGAAGIGGASGIVSQLLAIVPVVPVRLGLRNGDAATIPDPEDPSRRASGARYHHADMTDLAADPRVIDAESPVYNASLVRRDDETESLAYFWVRFDGEPTPFEPGQYMTIGVMVDGKIVQRP